VKYPLLDTLHDFVREGMCTRRRHPEHPIWIYNYSQKAQFEFSAESWPEALRDARGLVLDEDGHIVARGLKKFFNLSQLVTPPSGPAEFYEKADGSLILLFSYDGRRVVSTRGAFDSPQSLWASEVIAEKYGELVPPSGVTYCLEAIYPGNRIVVDYGGLSELVLLAAIDASTGADADHALTELQGHFRSARFYGALPPEEIPAVEGEGFVLRWSDGTRAKVKLDEYVRMHRMIYGTSSKTVWAMLRAGERPEASTPGLPLAIVEWVARCAQELRGRFDQRRRVFEARYAEAVGRGITQATRAEFAEWAKTQEHAKVYFMLLDGKAIDDLLWRMIEPEFYRPKWAEELE